MYIDDTLMNPDQSFLIYLFHIVLLYLFALCVDFCRRSSVEFGVNNCVYTAMDIFQHCSHHILDISLSVSSTVEIALFSTLQHKKSLSLSSTVKDYFLFLVVSDCLKILTYCVN